MKAKFSNSLKARSLMFLFAAGILSITFILICTIIYLPIFISAITGIGNSLDPEDYASRMVFIIFATLIVLQLIIYPLLTYGVWNAIQRIVKNSQINFLHRIAIFLLILMMTMGILFISKVYFI